MLQIINLESTGSKRSETFANKPRQRYGLFAKLSLSVIGACEVANNPHIFITIDNQHIQDIVRHFDGTLNQYGLIVLVENQEQI